MLIPVLIVSSLVHIYSIGYMSHDPQHFVSHKGLFTINIIFLGIVVAFYIVGMVYN